jgi:GT2 family glycosyltransferase
MLPKVFVIVLCFNGVELTLECIESLHNQDYLNIKICLVDNGSSDNTIPKVSAKFPDCLWIQNHENLGYSLGNNKGIEYALTTGADIVMLVNNDTRLEESCIKTLVHGLLAESKRGIIGPMVYTWDKDKTISSAGGLVNWRWADAENVGMGERDRGQYSGRVVDFINGCGIMASREAIERTGGLDPIYFMYWEETDWCQRVKKAGLEVVFEPLARMEHKQTIYNVDLKPTTLYYMTRNRFLFFSRHTPTSLKPIAIMRALKGTLHGILENRKVGKPEHAKAMQTALYHAATGRWGQANPQIWLPNPRIS